MRYDEDSYDISKLIGKMINSYNGMMEVINHINAIMNKTKILSLNLGVIFQTMHLILMKC